jgi:hypothetical protein
VSSLIKRNPTDFIPGNDGRSLSSHSPRHTTSSPLETKHKSRLNNPDVTLTELRNQCYNIIPFRKSIHFKWPNKRQCFTETQ